MNNPLNICSVYISGFRNFKDFKIKFSKNINVLIGPNGAGKSTILKLIKYSYRNQANYSLIKKNELSEEARIYFEYYSIKLTAKEVIRMGIMDNLKKYKLKDNNIEEKLGIIYSNATRWESVKNAGEVSGKAIIPIIVVKKTPFDEFYFLIDQTIYSVSWGNKFETEMPTYIGDYEDGNYKDKIVSDIERLPDIDNNFKKFTQDATKQVNKGITTSQKLMYTTTPSMRSILVNKDGTDVERLSSGQSQIAKISHFFGACTKLGKSLILIDEPEVHLNYGQMPDLSRSISSLSSSGSQVIIATHSNYFLRSCKNDEIKYINTNIESGDAVLHSFEDVDQRILRKIISYPEIFTCTKAVFVEELSTKVFFERSIRFLSKENHDNLEFISTHGKSEFQIVSSICRELGLSFRIITDFDFMRNKTDYSKILTDKDMDKVVNILSTLTSSITSNSLLKSLSGKEENLIFNVLEKVAKNMPTNAESNDAKLLLTRLTTHNTKSILERLRDRLFSLSDRIKLKRVLTIFKKYNIWILSKGTIEKYVASSYRHKSKLNLRMLIDGYYPDNIQDVKSALERGT